MRLVFAHFQKNFLKLVVTDPFLLVELISDFHSGVNVRNKVLRSGELEQVDVKGRHLRLNVVEQVSLLHVTALSADLNFFEKLGH